MAGFLMNVGKAGEVAERSPAVISANLKEDMLLQKKIVILNRSERSVVHQIKVDQKVLYKRFQSRLVRSKLAFARIMADKEIEKELRSKNIGGLNTDIVGLTEEEYSFLDKLEQRPCTANSFSPRISAGIRKRAVKKDIPEKDVDKLEKVKCDERASSAKGRLEAVAENETEIVQSESQDRGPVRPVTTTGLRLNTGMLLQNRIKRRQMSPIEESVELIVEAKDNNRQRKDKEAAENVQKGYADVSVTSKSASDEAELSGKADDEHDEFGEKKQTFEFLDHESEILNMRPKSMGNLQNFDESPPISPRQHSRRASKAADFFQEEKKIDLVGLRLKEAKLRDYTDRVYSFCEEIEEMIGSSNKPSVDYYASRLQASMTHRLANKPLVGVPGTPEDENKRSIGNLFVRSLTLPVLNLDFTDLTGKH